MSDFSASTLRQLEREGGGLWFGILALPSRSLLPAVDIYIYIFDFHVGPVKFQ